jgi:acetyl-CoA carboxylase carboxyl transferase subunit alpha
MYPAVTHGERRPRTAYREDARPVADAAGRCCFWCPSGMGSPAFGLSDYAPRLPSCILPPARPYRSRSAERGDPMNYLEFEKPLAEIEGKAEELRALARTDSGMDVTREAEQLDRKAEAALRDLYKSLTPWQKCQVARHPDRPHCKDYVEGLFTEFTPLAGDRAFADDHAVMGGLARFNDRPVVVIGHEKGHDTKTRIQHNFGMARPEGYRKAIRLMDLADRFRLPVITLIDTPGAYPGKGAEERGQAEAIARSTEKCLALGVPLISVVIGEGGSGGAVAFATANRIAMLEHSVYSVISPEGCASILWKDAEKMREAAEALRLTAQDLQKLGLIDRIVAEPVGGAQRAPRDAVAAVGKAIETMLKELSSKKPEALIRDRRQKFLDMGSKGLAA